MDDEGEMPVVAARAAAARLLLEAVGGDAIAHDRLVDMATGEPLAAWALQVVIELRVEAAGRAGGLPSPPPDVAERLERAAKAAVEERR